MTPERDLLARLQRALADVDVDAHEVLDHARRDARDEVEATLRRLLGHDLLRRCLEVLEAEAGAGPPTRREAAEADGAPADPEAGGAAGPDRAPVGPQAGEAGGEEATAVSRGAVATYVFGVVGADARPAPAQLARLPGGGPARTVVAGGLQALVCDVDPDTYEELRRPGPEGLETLAAAAHAHDEALAFLAGTTTVLPMRLGTVVADDDVVRRMLEAQADALASELSRLAGHTEWAVTVHLLDDEDAADDARSAATGSDYLRRRGEALQRRGSRRERRDELASRLHARLADCAAEADVVAARPVEDTVPPLLHGVYLLPPGAADGLERSVARLREEHPRTVIEYTGPWPPYHFTRAELSPPEATP